MCLPHRLLVPAIACLAVAARLGAQDRHGLDPANFDTTCAACQDFYRFANGGWLARNPVPDASPFWGTFTELQERNAEALRVLLTQAIESPLGSPEHKAGLLYATCMQADTVAHASTGCWSNVAAVMPRSKKPFVPTGAKYPSGVRCTLVSHSSDRPF